MMPSDTQTQDNRNERTPLLSQSHQSSSQRQAQNQSFRSQQNDSDDGARIINFSEGDPENPRNWTKRRKMTNIAIMALMAVLGPLASSMFTPGIQQIADDLDTTYDTVVGATTGFVIMLGLGPLILAPLSETFGRRNLYLICFSAFTIIQIPTALAPNIETLIVVRTIAGFFGSVSIANGAAAAADMFPPSERSGVTSYLLLGPLLGPTFGPLFGGLIVSAMTWRWIFWLLLIPCCINTFLGFLFLRETYAPVLLAERCKQASQKDGGHEYTFPDQDKRPLSEKLLYSLWRPLRILFTQPIVVVMAAYQAAIFAIMYSLFTNLQEIFQQEPYSFSSNEIGLLYLFPGFGFLLAVWFIVPKVDVVFNKLTEKNDGVSKPEYRLPLANIGAVLLPLSLFAFAWFVEFKLHWLVVIAPTFLFGIGQVAIFNCIQQYYIDAFAKYAASAIAAGAVMRSLVGGVIPLFSGSLFKSVGYGIGWSVFGIVMVVLAPIPILFQRYGGLVRKKFEITL